MGRTVSRGASVSPEPEYPEPVLMNPNILNPRRAESGAARGGNTSPGVYIPRSLSGPEISGTNLRNRSVPEAGSGEWRHADVQLEADVHFGDESDDEVCFFFFFITLKPRVEWYKSL